MTAIDPLGLGLEQEQSESLYEQALTLLKSKQHPPARLPLVGSSSASFLPELPSRNSIISYNHTIMCNQTGDATFISELDMRPQKVLFVNIQQLEFSILWSMDKQDFMPSRQQCLCKACDSDIVEHLWFAAYK